MNKRYYLDEVIRICGICGRVDIKTFISNGKRYTECQDCGEIKEIK